MRRRLTTAAVLLLALLACGGQDQDLSDRAAADLQARVARVRATASAGDKAGASGELATVRTTLASYRSQGQIGEGREERILVALDEVETRLALLAPPPSTTTSTVTTRPPARGGQEDGDGDGKGREDGGNKKKGD